MANGTSEKNIDIDGVKAKTAEKTDASQSPKGPSREYYYPYNKIHKDTTEPSEVPNNTDSKTTQEVDVTSKYISDLDKLSIVSAYERLHCVSEMECSFKA